jgi:hypothetical protein
MGNDMFRSKFELPGNMMLRNLSHIFATARPIRRHKIRAYSTRDKYVPDTFNPAQFAKQLELWTVVRLQRRACPRKQAASVPA